MVEAGAGALKYSRRTLWIASKCSMLRTKTSTRQMSSSVPPAASTAALRFSQTWRGCGSDVGRPGDRSGGRPGRHSGNEEEPATRLHHGGLREMAARLADPVARDLPLRHDKHRPPMMTLKVCRPTPPLSRHRQ